MLRVASSLRPLGALIGAMALLAACERSQRGSAEQASSASLPGLDSAAHPPLSLTPPEVKSPTLGPGPTVHAVGEAGQARDYFMKVVAIVNCKVEPHFHPGSGNRKLGVHVELGGRTDREVPSNPFHATLTDSEQRDYTADLAGCTPTLSAGRVTSGQLARGFITFEVPEAASGLVMTYAPFVVGVGTEELKFAIPE